ncbi:unnamed protein product, partial [Adineta steineri]
MNINCGSKFRLSP